MFNPRSPFLEPRPIAANSKVVPRAQTQQEPNGELAGRWLTAQDQIDIMDGAAFLSAGGGGAKALGEKLLQVMNGNRVRMVTAAMVPDEAHVVCSAYIGSPAAALHLNSLTFNSLERAVRALEEAAGFSASYLVPGEMGAVNSLAPILSACDLGRPVVDAGGCGRAVPLIAATTFGVQPKLAQYGAAAANDADDPAHYQSAVFSASNTTALQGGIGAMIGSPSYGKLGAAALWLMTGAELKQYAVPSGLSRALSLGAALRLAGGNYASVVLDQLKSFGTPGRILCEGSLLKPVKYVQHTSDNHDIGTFVLEREDGKGTVTVLSLNENILAYSSDQAAPIIQMPDMLCWLGADGATFDNAQLQADVTAGTAKPVYAIGVEAVQTVGVQANGPAFRDYPGIRPLMAAIMGAVGYSGEYVPFNAG